MADHTASTSDPDSNQSGAPRRGDDSAQKASDAKPDENKSEADEKGKGGGEKEGKDGDKKEADKPSKLKDPKVRIGLLIAAILVIVAFAVWFTWYWTTGRYRQSTDDAFLQADQVQVSSKIAGYVEEVLVQDNEEVKVGQPLVRINRQDTNAASEQARAQVAQGEASVLQIEAQIRQQRAQIAAADAQVRGARSTLAHAQTQVERYEALTPLGAQTAEELTQMRQNRDQAAAQLAGAVAQREGAARQIDTLRAQTAVAKAQIDAARAQLSKADADLQDTLLRSSIDGRIGNKTVQVGQFVQASTRLMSIVPVQNLYLVANFKETQIGLMRVGQPVTIKLDALAGESLQGTVESFSPGTGAQFALLPPQNATGNYTKIVQRVPVRIRVEDAPEARKVLVPGLSAVVTVDTIGTKPEKKRVKEEAKDNEDARKQEHEEAVERDRQASEPGPGR